MKKTLSENKIIIILVLAYSIIQIFLADPYFNDKTIVSSQITESMHLDGSIIAHEIPCHNKDHTKFSTYKNWAEEPPLYHLIGQIFFLTGAQNYLFKIYPLICFLIFSFGLYRIICSFVIKEKIDSFDKSFLALVILFQPYIYIHAHRPLPDNLSICFLVGFLYFFLKRNYRTSLIFSVLATTTKTLAIFPIFFMCVAYLIFGNENLKRKITIGLLHGLSVVPFLLWLYFLKNNQIENPFFALESFGVQQSGGNDFGILLTRKYWSKMLTWIFFRGLGPLVFIAAIRSLFKTKLNTALKYAMVGIVGHLVYIVVIRGAMRVAPWYAFYFLPFYIISASALIIKMKKKWKVAFLVVHLAYSIGFIKLTFNFKKNTNIKIPKAANLPCDFHNRNKQDARVYKQMDKS